MDTYILKGTVPVSENDHRKWGEWFETANRMVARTVIVPGKVEVSTVFLGIDHSFGSGAPVLFETMVFGGKMEDYQDRYTTWADADAGHKATVRKVQETECYHLKMWLV